MNLSFTPIVLALIFSIDSAGARGMGGAILSSGLADIYDDDINIFGNEKAKHRRLASSISTSLFDQGVSSGRRFYHPDVGILQGGMGRRRFGNDLMNGRGQRNDAGANDKLDNDQRFLQAEVAPLCGTNGTCLPSACDCRANGRRITEQCAPVFTSLCDGYIDENGKNWTLEGCFRYYSVYPDRQKYETNAYCKMSKCIADGGTYGSCYCQVYHSLCQSYGDERQYNSFAILGLCEVDKCCQNKTDEAGRMSCLIGYPNGYHGFHQYRADHPRCGLNGTCYPSICTCYANYKLGAPYFCAAPLNDICNGIVTDANGKQWGFEGCYRDYPDYPDFQLYTKTAYCEMAKCVVDGGSIVPCSCQMYHSLCDVFGDVRKYDTIPNREGFCTIDRCCQSKSDDAGMATCFELTNSTSTTSPTTSTNNTSSSSSALRTNSAGAMSLLVTAAAVLSLGCDGM